MPTKINTADLLKSTPTVRREMPDVTNPYDRTASDIANMRYLYFPFREPKDPHYAPSFYFRGVGRDRVQRLNWQTLGLRPLLTTDTVDTVSGPVLVGDVLGSTPLMSDHANTAHGRVVIGDLEFWWAPMIVVEPRREAWRRELERRSAPVRTKAEGEKLAEDAKAAGVTITDVSRSDVFKQLIEQTAGSRGFPIEGEE